MSNDGKLVDIDGEFLFSRDTAPGRRLVVKTVLADEIPSGSAFVLPCTAGFQPAAANGEAPEQRLALLVRAEAIGVKNESPKTKPPSANTPTALTTREYVVRPAFIRLLRKKPALSNPSMKELLSAEGVVFPEGSSAFFKRDTSVIIARLNEAGHKKIEEIISAHSK